MTRIFTPRPWQPGAIRHLLENLRCALFVPPGMGKTSMVLRALEILNLIEPVYPALVLAPLRVARDTWRDETQKWTFSKHLRVSPILGDKESRLAALKRPAEIYTCNYENIPWLVELYGKRWPFRTIISDECFPAGTKILTPRGDKNIDEINVGDVVSSHLGSRKVVKVFTKEVNDFNLVVLRLSNGEKIYATKEHPFFTDMGWINAESCGNRKLYGPNDLPSMQKHIRQRAPESTVFKQKWKNTVLFSILQNKGYFLKQSRFSETFFRKYERTTQNLWSCLEQGTTMACGNEKKNVGLGQSKRRDAESPRREWNGHDETRSYFARFFTDKFCMELSRKNKRKNGKWLSKLLQTGFWESINKSGHRSRWKFAQFFYAQSTRPEKREEVRVIGVDRYPFKKRDGSRTVFNIEVEEAHTYFAEGFLVHNCSRLKSFRPRQGGARAKALYKVAWPYCKRFWGLTGSPASNGLADLFGLMYFLDQGERLGRTFTSFEQRWFTRAWNGFSIEPQAHAYDEIMEKIKDLCLSIDPADWMDIKEPVTAIVYVDMPPAARKLYDDMEREMFVTIEEEGIEAFNAAAKRNKLVQMCNGAVYLEDGKTFKVTHDEKIQALESLVEEAAGMPVLVAYHYKSDLARLQKAFPHAVNLATAEGLAKFKTGKFAVGFAHPASLGHGIDGLQEVTNILVYFAHSDNLENHQQILERIGPMRQMQSGLDRPVFVYSIVARNTIEEWAVLPNLQGKGRLQDLIMKAMKR